MARTVQCPSCGATATSAALASGSCRYCGAALERPLGGPRASIRAGGASILSGVLGIMLLGLGIGAVLLLRKSAAPDPAVVQITEAVKASTAPAAPVVDVAPVEETNPAPVEKVEVPVPAPPPSGIAAGAEAGKPAVPPEPPPKAVETFQRLNGCLCRVDLDEVEGQETMQLGVSIRSSGQTITSAGVRHEATLGFALLPSQGDPIVLATAPDTAPPSVVVGHRLGVGMICDGNRVAIASQSSVTAWSIEDGSAVWTTPLDGTYPRAAGDTTDLSIDCGEIRVSKRAVRIPREGQAPLKLGLDTGAVLR